MACLQVHGVADVSVKAVQAQVEILCKDVKRLNQHAQTLRGNNRAGAEEFHLDVDSFIFNYQQRLDGLQNMCTEMTELYVFHIMKRKCA
jgi:hypothetical protein